MAERTGVIHDLGYRGYAGPRESLAAIAWTLFVTGLRHTYGLGRSGRSKVLPFILLAINVLPAAIAVGIVAMVGTDDLPFGYADHAGQMQTVVSLFAAAQAPVLFSRDLRHRSIVLYLARPLPPALFALVRWAALTASILLFVLIPTVVLYVGGLLAGLDAGEQTPDMLKTLALLTLLSMTLAAITGVISSVALRRGFAVVASIIVLIAVAGFVLIVQEIARYEEIRTVGELGGLLSPWAVYSALAFAWGATSEAMVDLTGGWVVLYVAVAAVVCAACVAMLVRRFAKVGAR